MSVKDLKMSVDENLRVTKSRGAVAPPKMLCSLKITA